MEIYLWYILLEKSLPLKNMSRAKLNIYLRLANLKYILISNFKGILHFNIQRKISLLSFILIVTGLIHIIFASYLKEKLSIITGITTINIALINTIRNIKNKEYKTLETMKIPENIVVMILGIMTLLKKNDAISFIAIIWGISGLRKGIKGLNVAIYNKVNNKRFVGELIHAIIETLLSILLVFNPFEKVEEHIIILGIEMIIMSLKVAFYNEKENEEIGD